MASTWKLLEIRWRLSFLLVTTLLIVSHQSLAFNEPPNLSPTHDQVFRQPAAQKQNPIMKSMSVKQIPIEVKEQGYINVAIKASRYDWLVGKPGTFTTEPLIIDVQSNQAVAVTFSNFDDLKSKAHNHGTIPVFYGFGATLAETERNGWIRAMKLNSRSVNTSPAPDGINHFLWKIWPKIEVTKTTRAGDYENTGYLTFTILETQNYLDNFPGQNGPAKILPDGEVLPEDQ